jgi:hypothetical protein
MILVHVDQARNTSTAMVNSVKNSNRQKAVLAPPFL